MNEFFNRESEKEKRRRLRKSMPDAEVILWSRLKERQLLECKFRRQYRVGSFVIDFFSAEIKLGIEVDGDSHFHDGAREYDQTRQHFIESFGIKIIRILNTDVYLNLDGVLEMIGRAIMTRREMAADSGTAEVVIRRCGECSIAIRATFNRTKFTLPMFPTAPSPHTRKQHDHVSDQQCDSTGVL